MCRFFFSSRRRHTRFSRDWSSDVCSSDLEDHKIRRVGGSKEIPVDVRIIAATNRNLPQAVNDGLFREDLFHRLDLFSVEMPPLQIGRASCRERVWMSERGVASKKTRKKLQ